MVLTAQNLAVVDVKSNHLTPEMQSWRDGKSVLCAESCARQVFYGFEEDMEGFPDPTQRVARRKFGAEAYSFLLELSCGFKSQRFGETHIRRQVFDRWKKLSQGASVSWKKQYESFVGGLRKDAAWIGNNIMSGFQRADAELVARDVSGQQRGDSVTIVADWNRWGALTGSTVKMARVSENRQRGRDRFFNCNAPRS